MHLVLINRLPNNLFARSPSICKFRIILLESLHLLCDLPLNGVKILTEIFFGDCP